MYLLLIASTFLSVSGCSDEVTTHFKSLAEARSMRAFERGWLPPLLPASAVNIVEKNDLDLNRGRGSFEYDPAEREMYREQLKSMGARPKSRASTQVLVIVRESSRWEIELPAGSNLGKYTMESKLERSSR
ncbi:MAG: hypothetical protein VCA55_15350 [Verrucomicrobiales bacterium]